MRRSKQLKQRLESEGLFDEGRKRPIPETPRRIGIVTSPTSAALQDMLSVLARRWPLCEVILAPSLVQGEDAPAALVDAFFNLYDVDLDLIIVARGGGSIEDLWAFNDESVARAIFAAPVPVITGVGHETDTTVVDYVADLRAATPTAAAVLATPDIAELQEADRRTAAAAGRGDHQPYGRPAGRAGAAPMRACCGSHRPARLQTDRVAGDAAWGTARTEHGVSLAA